MLRRLACAALVASPLLGLGCGSRTPLDLDDIYDGDDDGAGGTGSGSSSSGASSGSGSSPCEAPTLPTIPPMLWYPFDDHTRNEGYYGGGLFDGYGEQTSFTGGVLGSAIQIAQPNGRVDLSGTAVPFAEVSAMTLVLWFQESQAPALNTPVFSNRNFYQGMQFYRGAYDDSMPICWGAGHPANGPGECVPIPHLVGGWHQLLLLRSSRTAETEIWLDAARVGTLSTAGFDLFAGADDMLLGDTTVGDLDGSGTLRLDDVRLYDQALDAAQRCSELGAFWCDADCDL